MGHRIIDLGNGFGAIFFLHIFDCIIVNILVIIDGLNTRGTTDGAAAVHPYSLSPSRRTSARNIAKFATSGTSRLAPLVLIIL